ncbi:MAG: hypothetical protein COW01_14570 [Bdellovibrionales bacterium CG12_big_fil_rev_8_21_14_0_65_38_15]|nr:MAG: hypothetical protein COW79_10280 [Bdellovibrionales bacterium CG22_combo_CG10-13_8_21_14_all_38_13]PIQ53165.1 MAG: hypothetical protein COW01_14570 [Bdellovibrionales bacterium CG12_big_fil_rev_8_21_14_0_65_38_15]
MNKYLLLSLIYCSSVFAAQNYTITFPKDWSVKENSFGADYFAYSPIIIDKDSASFFVKEYAADIKDPLDFIQNDIEKNILKNSKKYKNLNIYSKKNITLNKRVFSVVEYYYFDNTQDKIIFSQIAILKNNSKYIYFNLAGNEATFKEYKDDAETMMKTLKLNP